MEGRGGERLAYHSEVWFIGLCCVVLRCVVYMDWIELG